MVGLIGEIVESGTYMAGCARTEGKRCEDSQELVRGMNIKLEQDCMYAYGHEIDMVIDMGIHHT
jgi:hypothetical protein